MDRSFHYYGCPLQNQVVGTDQSEKSIQESTKFGLFSKDSLLDSSHGAVDEDRFHFIIIGALLQRSISLILPIRITF